MKQIILMSIQPKYVSKILNGEKTIEVRKHPLREGDEVHLYCTKRKPFMTIEYDHYFAVSFPPAKNSGLEVLNGKVVAEFIVGKVEKINIAESDFFYTSSLNSHSLYEQSCLSYGELLKYLALGRFGAFAIEITKLEIFDKPRELGEYYTYRKKTVYSGMDCPPYVDDVKCQITHAPQSYMKAWVEE